ncbi:MAG: beta-galactosidase GalB [Ignavibacteria bacterium]
MEKITPRSKKHNIVYLSLILVLLVAILYLNKEIFADAQSGIRKTEDFRNNWKFYLGDIVNSQEIELNDSSWRTLSLPHDWSIEGVFNEDNPAGVGGGALPGGIGWYRKAFIINESEKDKLVFIDFDGVYRNSEVWINGKYLGKRPNGYSSFRYELTPYLKYGNEKNLLAVKVDNSKQPNSRWYSGSGIYRNVWLVTTNKVYVDHWGTFVTTPKVTKNLAKVSISVKIRNAAVDDKTVTIKTTVLNKTGEKIAETETPALINKDSVADITQEVAIEKPELWSVENPSLYKAITTVECNNQISDDYTTTFGIRTFSFDIDKGFFLNGRQTKIYGVCNHHDLGCLGAAINKRALERQLEILKDMGCNGIRTSHNPPAPELLDLCDEMGFIVMDEAFDMWKRGKTEYDYSLDWDEWHKRDLEDLVLRDRNHPSIFMWSIGNEIPEQWSKDSSGILITRELVGIIKNLDTTRYITTNCNFTGTSNELIRSGALDIIGFSYHEDDYELFPENFPGQKLIGSETTSALETRGSYDLLSDSIRKWPVRWDIPFNEGNPDNTCSAYDNCRAPWGATHEKALKFVNKYDYVSGMYIWTGFDYLGEPTPYRWPSRSSYFGIIDLAGFPKDVYYLYQSEWTDKIVLHVFPPWNSECWTQDIQKGDSVDVWAYTNCDEVELFLNGESLGKRKNNNEDLHLMWRIPFSPGVIKAVGKNGGTEVLTTISKTAGPPAQISLEADRNTISADGKDLSFITVKILDKDGTVVPYADNLINFNISGSGKIIGVDNGSQTSHEPFKADYRKAFNGKCLVVIQNNNTQGNIILEAVSEGLKGASLVVEAEKK